MGGGTGGRQANKDQVRHIISNQTWRESHRDNVVGAFERKKKTLHETGSEQKVTTQHFTLPKIHETPRKSDYKKKKANDMNYQTMRW